MSTSLQKNNKRQTTTIEKQPKNRLEHPAVSKGIIRAAMKLATLVRNLQRSFMAEELGNHHYV